MKKFVMKVLLSWFISSFFGIFLMLHGSSNSFARIGLALFFAYAFLLEIWIILIYLIIQLFLYFFNIIDRNVFFSIGLIGVLFNVILGEFQNISTIGGFLHYLPSLILVLIGTAYWFWERNKKKS